MQQIRYLKVKILSEDTVAIKKSTYRNLIIVVVVVLVIASFLVVYLMGNSGKVPVTGQVINEGTTQEPSARISVSVDDDPVMGDKSAKVTVIEFGDFQCVFCGRFFQQTEPQMVKDYVDTKKVKFVYRDFPLDSIHAQARPAANAANCANEQGKFWEYHNKLFENQDSLDEANYKIWASDLGLDTTKFNECLASNKYDSEVTKDFQDGVDAGVSGTPTLFIGSPSKGYITIVGAQPYSAVKQIIDQELAG